jgi:3-oxoacyl-[acyl-carrier protein] reductase
MTGADRPVSIITGGTSGIGLATALRLARRGDRVVAGHHGPDGHDRAAALAQLQAADPDALVVDVDVADSASVASWVAEAASRHGRVDHVIANAGILRAAPIAEMTDAAWDEVLNVDLGGVVRVVRETVGHLGPGSSIVAVSSIVGAQYGWAEHAHYASAKAAVVALIRSLAIELGPAGVRANAIVPGVVRSPQSLDARHSLGADGLAAAARVIPLRRVGDVDEIAAVAEFLTSPASSFVSGHALFADGGHSAVMPG